ncbi:MAG TPA: hypothetical protein PLH83_10110, partial [Ruminococcus sp.]|nr:hypothetical protein [Ruminococcus sp.]
MSLYSDFYSRLLPGNYALTKSMELTKIHNSGTLWYTKKSLTLYYFIPDSAKLSPPSTVQNSVNM